MAKSRKVSRERAPKDAGLDHSWAKKRSENIERMWRQARTDDVIALAIAMDVISARSSDMRQVGDTSYAILLSAVSVRLGNIRSILLRNKQAIAQAKKANRR